MKQTLKLQHIVGNEALRPVFNNIFVDVKNNSIVAGDVYCILKVKLDYIFRDIKFPYDKFYITAKDWKLLTKEYMFLTCNNDLMEVVRDNIHSDYIKLIPENKIGRYPDYNRVIETKNAGNKTKAIVNLKTMQKLLKALGNMKLEFTLIDDSIHFRSERNIVKGVMMSLRNF